MTVRRDGEKLRLEGVTFEMKEDPDTGARVLIYDFIIRGERQTVWTTVKQAARTECSLGIWVFTSFGDLIRGKYGLNELSGPVGTVGVISDAVSQSIATGGWSEGFANLIYLLALITVNVGVFNLFPLPALDGGRLLLLVIEGITRRKLPAKVESIINLVGLAALLLFMLIITGSDIWKIFVK